MRIISGLKKGMRIKAPKGTKTRPTEDRIKESLFNILYNINEEDIILDLFAGSGSIGLEFLSRGARYVYFIEDSKEGVICIRNNIEHLNFNDNCKIIKRDYLKALEYFNKKNIKFDYIFMDPPYGRGYIEKAFKKIEEIDILNTDALIIVEHEQELEFDLKYYSLELLNTRDYGSKNISFFRRIYI